MTPPATQPAAQQPVAAALAVTDEEAEALTVFGARGDTAPQGRSRFLGLVLTLVLLAFLGALALWSSFFVDGGVSGLLVRDDDRIVAEDEEAAADAAEFDLSRLAEPGIDPSETPRDLALPRESTLTLDPTTPADVPPIEIGLADPAVAEAVYAATGVWQLPPAAPVAPKPGSIHTLYVASIDPATTTHDALAIPAIVGADDLPVVKQRPPAPFGTKFEFDARGLVVARPEGALTPEGVLVIAGQPSHVAPPERLNVVALPPDGAAAGSNGDRCSRRRARRLPAAPASGRSDPTE